MEKLKRRSDAMSMLIKDVLAEFYKSQNNYRIGKSMAYIIVSNFPVTDGSDRESGEMFTISQAKEIGEQLEVDFFVVDLLEYYIMINKFYSTYYRTAQAIGNTNPLFFGMLAADWFYDIDADENKTINHFIK